MLALQGAAPHQASPLCCWVLTLVVDGEVLLAQLHDHPWQGGEGAQCQQDPELQDGRWWGRWSKGHAHSVQDHSPRLRWFSPVTGQTHPPEHAAHRELGHDRSPRLPCYAQVCGPRTSLPVRVMSKPAMNGKNSLVPKSPATDDWLPNVGTRRFVAVEFARACPEVVAGELPAVTSAISGQHGWTDMGSCRLVYT